MLQLTSQRVVRNVGASTFVKAFKQVQGECADAQIGGCCNVEEGR